MVVVSSVPPLRLLLYARLVADYRPHPHPPYLRGPFTEPNSSCRFVTMLIEMKLSPPDQSRLRPTRSFCPRVGWNGEVLVPRGTTSRFVPALQEAPVTDKTLQPNAGITCPTCDMSQGDLCLSSLSYTNRKDDRSRVSSVTNGELPFIISEGSCSSRGS